MNYSKSAMGMALAAAIAAAATPAMAETDRTDSVIFCKVAFTINDGGDAILSVTIPATEGATDYDGRPTRIWNLGNVMVGGVYDSFYNGGPGYFQVQNNGTLPAFVYVSTGFGTGEIDGGEVDADFYYYSAMQLWGDNCGSSLFPVALPKFQIDAQSRYALAVSTDVTALVPAWQPLSWVRNVSTGQFVDAATAIRGDGYDYVFLGGGMQVEEGCHYAYLGYMPIGETQLFDLKFWAPTYYIWDISGWFVVRIEASAMKLWDHDR